MRFQVIFPSTMALLNINWLNDSDFIRITLVCIDVVLLKIFYKENRPHYQTFFVMLSLYFAPVGFLLVLWDPFGDKQYFRIAFPNIK